MDYKNLKPITKKIKTLILNVFPESILDDCIVFEKFNFFFSDMESDCQLKTINSNQNIIVGNIHNIFLISNVDGLFHIQKLKENCSFLIPEGFIHPDFKNLVDLNFKNFSNYLMFKNLNHKLKKQNIHSFNKI